MEPPAAVQWTGLRPVSDLFSLLAFRLWPVRPPLRTGDPGPCGVENFFNTHSLRSLKNFPITSHSALSSAGPNRACQKGKKIGGHQVCRT